MGIFFLPDNIGIAGKTLSVCVCVLRFDVDFTEVHSYMTRGEAILQSPEFSVSRKDGSIQELHDKVQVKCATPHRAQSAAACDAEGPSYCWE